MFIVNFNDEAFLDVPFTSDMKKMEQGLARIDSRGGTAMRDAVSMSLDYIRDKAKKDKKVLLVITDGNDNASNITLEKSGCAFQPERDADLRYRPFHRRRTPRGDEGQARALNELTAATGGLAFYPKDVSEVQELAGEIAKDIRQSIHHCLQSWHPGSRRQLPPDQSNRGRTR